MKEFLFSLVKSFITAGLKALIAIHKVKHGDAKSNQLTGMIQVVITELKPLSTETKTHVDDDIIEILQNALPPKT